MNYIDTALELASEAAKQGEVPVGAVIVFNNQVIAKAHNKKECLQNSLMHAELIAIEQASNFLKTWRLNECELYVTLEPCPMCMAALQQARIKKVYYGAEDLKGGAISLGFNLNHDLRLNHRFDVEYVKNEKCGEILTDFFKLKRKKIDQKN